MVIKFKYLLFKCNIKYIGEDGLKLAKDELANSDDYISYILALWFIKKTESENTQNLITAVVFWVF